MPLQRNTWNYFLFCRCILSSEKHIASALILQLQALQWRRVLRPRSEHYIRTFLIESIYTWEATLISASKGLLKVEIGTLAKSYISCTQISLLCRTRGSAEHQGLNTEDKSFCEYKPFYRSEKREANSPQKLGLHKWIFGRNLPLYILICICVDYGLCSRIQSPGLERIINTYHSMPGRPVSLFQSQVRKA